MFIGEVRAIIKKLVGELGAQFGANGDRDTSSDLLTDIRKERSQTKDNGKGGELRGNRCEALLKDLDDDGGKEECLHDGDHRGGERNGEGGY